MKIEKYALLDTDFISKTHFIHGDTEKCLVDLVVEMPGYCFFCHSQIIKELSRHNQQAIGWLQHKISEQKIQCYTDEEILNELVKIRGDFACSTYTLMLKDACDAFSKSYFKEHYQTLENFDVVTSTKQDYLETLQKADDEIGKHNSLGEIKSYVLLQLLSLLKGEQVYVFCSDDKAARNGAISFNNVRCISALSASDTIKPRLERCGADCRKVAFINEETYSGLTLDDERIRQAIIEFRPWLVVIDPIQAYLGSDSDLQIAGRARKLMQRLGMWASVYDCAIVLIGHLNKKEGTKGLYRSLGSIDVVAAARSVLQVERDSEDANIRIVRQIKNSLAPSDGEIRFSITAETGFQWLECRSASIPSAEPEVPEFASKTEKAAYLIKKLLSDGDMSAREIYMRMKDEGISRRTAENTKKELAIRSYRKMRQWYWSIHTGE